MKVSIDDGCEPMTSCIGFLEAPLDTLAVALQQWRRGHPTGMPGEELRIVEERLCEPFPAVLHRLEPLQPTGVWQELLLSTRSRWTAYFDNSSDGTDAFPMVSSLSKALQCQGLIVTHVPQTPQQFGTVQFELFGPEATSDLGYVRTISAMNDGGRWVFHVEGEVQPYEQPERYTARRISDRFTAQMLADYCAALGVRYVDPDFYGSEGVLLSYPDGHESESA